MKRLTREKQMSRTVILLAASLIFPRASFCGENFRIEPWQSAVNFSVRHMVLTTVHGKFTDFSGILELEEGGLRVTLIKAVVKAVTPWRERTVVRLVVGELESAELTIGQRLGLKMTPPAEAVENSAYPPDMDRPRTKAEPAQRDAPLMILVDSNVIIDVLSNDAAWLAWSEAALIDAAKSGCTRSKILSNSSRAYSPSSRKL